MKKLLLIAALASMSAPAFASKARVTALGNAAHVKDTQTVFENPSHLTLMGDYVTFEAGPSTSASLATSPGITAGTTKWSDLAMVNNPNAEGGFVRSAGDAKYMAYLGRKSAFTDSMRRNFGFLQQENPIELQYAMKGAINWGAGLNYSSSDQKSVSQKQQTYGVRAGASTDTWEAFAVVGLVSKAEGTTLTNVLTGDADADDIVDAGEISTVAADTTAEYKGSTGFKVGGAYKMENLYFFGKYSQDGFKYTGASATFNDLDVKASQIDVGVVDHNKIDGGQWFYGVSVQIYNSKQSNTAIDKKTDATYLPFLVGVEYDAASWLTLRASATQNVAIGSTKTDDGAATLPDETDTIPNNTKVAAGLGLKFNKWIVDGSWAAQTTGNVNTTNFVTNLGMTYSF